VTPRSTHNFVDEFGDRVEVRVYEVESTEPVVIHQRKRQHGGVALSIVEVRRLRDVLTTVLRDRGMDGG
jgi:hypothetical protein